MLFVPTAIAVTFLVKHSGQRHLYYLPPSQKEYASKLDWISQPFNIMSLATGKVSVALLILRLLGPSAFWRRFLLYTICILSIVLGILGATFTFVQCKPARTLWEGPIKNPNAKCWDPSVQLHYELFLSSESRVHSVRAHTIAYVDEVIMLQWTFYSPCCQLHSYGT